MLSTDIKPTPVLFSGVNKWQTVNRALFAGVFVAGIGLGNEYQHFYIPVNEASLSNEKL